MDRELTQAVSQIVAALTATDIFNNTGSLDELTDARALLNSAEFRLDCYQQRLRDERRKETAA